MLGQTVNTNWSCGHHRSSLYEYLLPLFAFITQVFFRKSLWLYQHFTFLYIILMSKIHVHVYIAQFQQPKPFFLDFVDFLILHFLWNYSSFIGLTKHGEVIV